MENKQYCTVWSWTVPKSNRRNRDKIDTHNAHIHDHTLSFFGTGTSIKSCWAKLVYGSKPPLSVKWTSRAIVFHMKNWIKSFVKKGQGCYDNAWSWNIGI
jgi:hypothetical protein